MKINMKFKFIKKKGEKLLAEKKLKNNSYLYSRFIIKQIINYFD